MKTTLKKAELSRDDVVALDLLTARQRDILRSVLIGHTNREIADMLGISMRTVEVHRFNLMHILGVRNIAQLFRWAHKLGLLSIFPPRPQASSGGEPVNRHKSHSNARGGRLLSFRKRDRN